MPLISKQVFASKLDSVILVYSKNQVYMQVNYGLQLKARIFLQVVRYLYFNE